jgi:hypothetical protein
VCLLAGGEKIGGPICTSNLHSVGSRGSQISLKDYLLKVWCQLTAWKMQRSFAFSRMTTIYLQNKYARYSLITDECNAITVLIYLCSWEEFWLVNMSGVLIFSLLSNSNSKALFSVVCGLVFSYQFTYLALPVWLKMIKYLSCHTASFDLGMSCHTASSSVLPQLASSSIGWIDPANPLEHGSQQNYRYG